MMIETLISMVRYLSARKDDDFADRMNYLYTPNMLLAFSVLISFKQFGGRPLECMFPNKFPGSWEQYAENFCWSEDTYYLPPEVHVAQVHESERYSSERKLSYYQWVPFFLLFQAACFRFPSLIWKAVSLGSGVRVQDIVLKAQDSQNMEESSRQQTLQVLANHLARSLRFQNQILRRHLIIHKTLRFLNITYSACFISLMYLLTKLLYLANVFAQLYLMNKFLETDRYHWYGFSVFRDIIVGIPWQSSGYFPRVSLCDFTIRQVANIQKYSVQCVLVINIFTEKIFILLWFWYGLLLVATSISFIYWTTIMLFPQFGRWYVAQAFELHQMDPTQKQLDAQTIKRERKNLIRFVDEFLKNDGVFTLRMLSLHTGILFTSELVAELYRLYDEMMENNDGKAFSEESTMKMEDGTLPAAKFKSPMKKSNKKLVENHYQKIREPDKKRADSAPNTAGGGDDLMDEMITSLVPIGNAAGNQQVSSSSSASEAEQQNLDNNDHGEGNVNGGKSEGRTKKRKH